MGPAPPKHQDTLPLVIPALVVPTCSYPLLCKLSLQKRAGFSPLCSNQLIGKHTLFNINIAISSSLVDINGAIKIFTFQIALKKKIRQIGSLDVSQAF